MCAWVAIGIAGGSALVKGITGIVQGNKADKMDANNPFPTRTVDPLYQKNLAQAEQMAQTGTPSQQYNNQSNSINRNQAGGLASLTRTGNNSGGIASIVRASNDANNTLNAQDAMARNRNLMQLLQERRQLAGQRDKNWDWNYQQKYLDNLAKSNALRGSSNYNINGAFNDVAGVGLAGIQAGGIGNGATATGGGDFNYTPYTPQGNQTQLATGNFGYGANFNPNGWGYMK